MEIRTHVAPVGDIVPALAALRTELELPSSYPADALADAAAAATKPLGQRFDATDLPLVTLDPPGSRDLDQAFAIERRGAGFRFVYAIADVGWYVAPGGPLDTETRRRGETVYLPDGRVPLHPLPMSEGFASLLPGEPRPAVLWQFELDADGEPTSVDVRRAIVRSRAQLDYPSLQHDRGDVFDGLRAVGLLRQERERQRGGVSLSTPEQEVTADAGGWSLAYRASLPVEDWNAQLSLLTGMAAARLMLDAGVGLLRTMPPPDAGVVASLRRSALALGVDWPPAASYADVVRRLDSNVPAQAAVLRLASVLFRGAGYAVIEKAHHDAPAELSHAAVAAPYAHAPAPLRRLADRFVSECCLAACAGIAPPAWAVDALPLLPELMAASGRRAHAAERAVIDLAEALVLQPRVGEVFSGVVVEASERHGEVQLTDPAVRAPLSGSGLPLGERIDVRLASVDVAKRRVGFVPA